MPEPKVKQPPLGWRYANLSAGESRALRRGFKLPLDALMTARSINDLSGAAVVAPLPNPNRPLLAVASAGDASDPFADTTTTSFRDDPLRALGEMLGAAEAASDGAGSPAMPEVDDPFGGVATESPAATSEPTAPTAEVEASEDPFGGSDDPFGGAGSDDPFGDF